jgi:hypothetical protein
MTLTIAEILHIRKVALGAAVRPELNSAMTAAQQAKLDEINALLIEIGEPTLDEELDATILELTEIRDRE